MTRSQIKRLGVCPKCLEKKPLTKHHIFPVRFFGKNDYLIKICRSCHDKIEAIIKSKEMDNYGELRKIEYLNLTVKFIFTSLFYLNLAEGRAAYEKTRTRLVENEF